MAFDLGAIIAHVKADLSDFKNGLDTARKEGESFKDNFTDNLKTVGIAAGVVTSAIAAIGAVTYSLAKDAAKYNTIRDSFTSMTKGIVDDVDEFQSRVAKASGNTLDNLTILQGGTRALSLIGKDSFKDFGKDFEEMAMLSKKASRATGQDVNFMFDSLILGVSRSSKMILDNLGVNVSLEESYKRFAEQAGKSADALTMQEQKAALLQSTLKALHDNYDSVAISAGGLQGITQQLQPTLTNLRIEIGQQLEPSFNQLGRTILPLVQQYGPQLVLLIQQAIQWFTNLDPSIRNTILIFIGLIPVVAAVIGIALALITVLTALLNPFVLVGIGLTLLAATFLANWNYISSIVMSNVAFITMLITSGWETIKAIFNEGVNFITSTLSAGWSMIRGIYNSGVNFVTSTLNNGLHAIRSIGNSIKDALIGPFQDAWNSIQDLVNKIKDKLDFTKRHSPSILDIVKSGVGKVNDALGQLDYGINITPHAAVSMPTAIPTGNSVNGVSIQIDMSNAIISDEVGAMRIGEIMGDGIIKKLNTQIRF